MNSIHYFVFANNQRIEKDATHFSLASESALPSSVFTTFATHSIDARSKKAKHLGLTIEQALLKLDSHIERLINNAKALSFYDKQISEHKANWIKKIVLKELGDYFEKEKCFDKRIKARLILRKGELQLTIEPLIENWPSDATISCLSVSLERKNPGLKTTNIAASARARKIALENNCEEALLINDAGFVTEGSYSNLFWFEKDGTLYTPKSDMLPGITREVVCGLTHCTELDIKLSDLRKKASEVFITQSTTGITPVAKIDDQIIGSGKHERTLALKSKYQDYLKEHCLAIFAGDETN